MATIKSYTDLEQSKKLAEILPLESADMLWGYYYNGKNHCVPNIRPFRDGRNEIPKGYTPAWSLAALLDILPKQVMLSGSSEDSYWYCKCEDASNFLFADSNNPVDACVEMIIKLNELKML